MTNRNVDLVEPGLYIGGYEARKFIDELDVKCVVCICTNSEYGSIPGWRFIEDEEIAEHHIKLDDDITENITPATLEMVKIIADSLTKKRNVLVHCMVGRSRSASLVIAYLMFKHKITFQDALERLNKVRAVFPNESFVQQLRALEKTFLYKRIRTIHITAKCLTSFLILLKSKGRSFDLGCVMPKNMVLVLSIRISATSWSSLGLPIMAQILL